MSGARKKTYVQDWVRSTQEHPKLREVRVKLSECEAATAATNQMYNEMKTVSGQLRKEMESIKKYSEKISALSGHVVGDKWCLDISTEEHETIINQLENRINLLREIWKEQYAVVKDMEEYLDCEETEKDHTYGEGSAFTSEDKAKIKQDRKRIEMIREEISCQLKFLWLKLRDLKDCYSCEMKEIKKLKKNWKKNRMLKLEEAVELFQVSTNMSAKEIEALKGSLTVSKQFASALQQTLKDGLKKEKTAKERAEKLLAKENKKFKDTEERMRSLSAFHNSVSEENCALKSCLKEMEKQIEGMKQDTKARALELENMKDTIAILHIALEDKTNELQELKKKNKQLQIYYETEIANLTIDNEHMKMDYDKKLQEKEMELKKLEEKIAEVEEEKKTVAARPGDVP